MLGKFRFIADYDHEEGPLPCIAVLDTVVLIAVRVQQRWWLQGGKDHDQVHRGVSL